MSLAHFNLHDLRKQVDPEKILKLLGSLTDEEATLLQYQWSFWARPQQLPPTLNSTTSWLTWLILAGRGFGKTRSGAEWVRDLVEHHKYRRIALVAEDAGDARDVMVEGESGIIAVSPPWNKPNYEPSKRRLTWPNGARATIFSADDPESLRGPQHDAAWLDELCKWRYQQEAWDQLQFGLRLGKKPVQCITTTPKPTKLLKEIVARRSTLITKGHTYDNLDNLAESFREAIVSRYEGTRLGRQELSAEILDDNPNALFHQGLIDSSRKKFSEVPEDLNMTVVAVDPPTTGNADSDECGIITASRDTPNTNHAHFYVHEDSTVQGRSPEGWAAMAVSQYYKHMANAIVCEVNQGGDMVESTIKNVDPTVKVIKVRASKGKWIRAEPIAGLYEQGRVHHVGSFSDLEDQMCDFDPSGTIEGKSPDRLDALVWGLAELSNRKQAEPRMRNL
jgi:phage terminase large subunit-like protein